MIKGRAAVGVCAVCALVVSMAVVQSAVAATNGTTGFTCKESKVGGAGFSDAHCTAAVGTGAKFEHVAFAENVTTEGRVTGGIAKLHSVISGVEVELQATATEGIANGMNTKAANGEHFAQGTGATTYSGVTVTKPEGKGCKVSGGEIKTKELKGTSAGQGMAGKLEPAAGGLFAEFNIEGCSIAALNGKYEVKGSIVCSGEGSTVICTRAATTAQGTLTLRGQKAGIEVSTTATARANSSEPYTPLAVTTIATP